MSDTVSISFGGNTAEFEAACQRAQAAMQALTASVTAMTSGLSGASQGLNAATPAAAALSQAVTQSATAARTASSNLQDLINATTGVGRETRSAASSADVFRIALGDQTNEVKALRAAMDDVAPGAGRAAHASGGVTRELLVLGHEAMMGNFSRFGGSLVVMAELMGNVSIQTIAAGGAIALAGVAVYHLIANFREAAREAAALNAQMVLMGRDPMAATEAAKRLADQLHQVGEFGGSDARHVADQFVRLHGTTDDLRESLALLVPAIKATTTEPVDKVSEAFARTAQSIAGIKRFFDENDLWDSAQMREQMVGFEMQNNLIGAQTLLVTRLKDRFADFEASKSRAAAATRDANIGALPGIEAPQPQPLKLSQPAQNPQEAHLDEQQAKLNEGKQTEIGLDQTIAALRERLAHTSDEAAKADVESALKVAEAQRAQLREAGDTSWAQKQEGALARETAAAVKAATTSRAATEAKLQTEVNFWTRVAAGSDLSATQREQAEIRLSRATTQLAEERLRAKEAVDRGAVTSTRKSVQEQLAELSAQQAANRDDYTTWTSLEGQKLAILRSAYGEKSREFLSELRAEESYQREHVAKLEQQELASLQRRNQAGQKELAEKIANMQAEGIADGASKAAQLDNQAQLTLAEGNAELTRLDNFIGTLTKGTDEFRKATEQRQSLYQEFRTKLAQIDREIAQDNKRTADQSTPEYARAFDRIGSQGESIITGLVDGTMTWRRAEQQATTAVMSSFVQLAMHVLAQWAAKEAFQTATSQAGVAARHALEEGASSGSVIAKYLASWLGLESSKTAATSTQAGLRTGVEASADATGAADGSVAALAQIKAQAAAAAAGAYAATAAIPYVGPALAPEAATTAFMGAMSFAATVAVPSFAVGAWNLPSDMLAQVHKGEMIVPAFAADAARNGGIGGGSDVHLHINAVDAASFTTHFARNIATIARQLQSYRRLNPSLA